MFTVWSTCPFVMTFVTAYSNKQGSEVMFFRQDTLGEQRSNDSYVHNPICVQIDTIVFFYFQSHKICTAASELVKPFFCKPPYLKSLSSKVRRRPFLTSFPVIMRH